MTQAKKPDKIEKIGIITKKNIFEYKKLIHDTVKFLKSRNKEVYYDNNCANIIKGVNGLKKEKRCIRYTAATVMAFSLKGRMAFPTLQKSRLILIMPVSWPIKTSTR